MRELDTETLETPVIWPAWCYQSGELASETSPQTASSPSLQISPTSITSSAANGTLSNSENHKARGKRKPIHNPIQYSVDKMLNERNKLIESSKKFNNNNNNYSGNLVISNVHSAAANNLYNNSGNHAVNSSNNNNNDRLKSSDNNMNFIKNGQLSPATAQKLTQITLSKCLANNSNGINNANKANGNGSTVKTERLTPPLSDLSMYRSRSVTPQSVTGTSPQSTQPNNLMNNPNISSLLSAASNVGQHLGNGGNVNQRSELPGPPLNYSDMMRTLAAKYNNSNDLPTPKNTFMESRIKSNREPSTSNDKKSSPPPPQQITPNPNLLTSLFSSLQFNQNSIFNPMLDMGSTRALVLLARAAQDAELQKLIKDTEKTRKLPTLQNFPTTSTQMPNLGNFNNFNPFPALTNLQALHQLSNRSPPAPPTTNTQSPYKSPSTADNPTGITPLDLSSSGTPPLAKRIKLSPTSTETATRQQQQATSPNVTTTNNQLSASGFSTSSSSSTTSNGSEQAVNNQPSQKCQIKIDEINAWNVDEVCSFVETIDICAEYVKNFQEQSIDGEGLMMLTEEHLINILGMKLGPALKLRSKLVKRLNQPCNCPSCSAPSTNQTNGNDESLIDSKSFINNFTKMSIPRAGSADSAKF